MIRCRFKANPDDPRPIKWPVEHPYWVTGESFGCSILVAYADSEEQILENWPEAEELDSEQVEGYTFTSRFPKPNWFNGG